MVEAAPSPSFKMSLPDLLLEFLIVAFDPPFDFPRESPNFCLLLLANIGGNTCLGLSRDPENVRHH